MSVKGLFGLEEFLSEAKADKASDSTVGCLRRDLLLFSAFLDDLGLSPKKATTLDIFTFYSSVSGERKSSTCSRIINSVRRYYSWLSEKGFVSKNPAEPLKALHGERTSPELLSVREMSDVADAANGEGFLCARDRAIAEFACNGLRPSEISALNTSDLEVRTAHVIVYVEGKTRAVPLSASANKAIRLYLRKYSYLLTGIHGSPMFINARGTRLSRQSVWSIVSDCAKSAIPEKTVTPTLLRMSYGAELLRNGTSPQDVKEIMGYADISSVYELRRTVMKKEN